MESMDRTHLDPARTGQRATTEPQQELRTIGEFRVLRRLGEGGMGSVYLAFHEKLNRQVAIKVLSDQLTAKDATYLERFYREARSSTSLNHPSIVRGLALGQDPRTGKHFLVLEYVDGFSAHELLDRFGRLSVGDAVHIILDIARALEHAHSRSVIHRDIKPDNILITRSGVAKLADLGLAKRTDESSTLTSANLAFGTPYYMPYEQAMNARNADGRSDIFALGATFYHLLTGEVPFPGENHTVLTEKKALGEFVTASLLNTSIPRVLDQILAKMLAREPTDRYQTASELIVDLERSRLAAAVPTFADPDLALQDPYMRACMASTAQPTMPDLSQSVSGPSTPRDTPSVENKIWHVRFRKENGQLCQFRFTPERLEKLLRLGKIPLNARASLEARKGYRPLTDIEALRPWLTAPAGPPLGEPKPTRPVRVRSSTEDGSFSPATPRRVRWLWGAGVTTLVITGGLLLLYLLYLHN